MRLTKSANQNRSGFTLIEVLMAVLLIAILATIAITQFTNFARDTRNATTKENLGILRNAIQKHFGMMRLRCNNLSNGYPQVDSMNANDITQGTSGCTTTDVPELTDRYFVAGGIPENPWSEKGCSSSNKRIVVDSNLNDSTMNIGTAATTIAVGGFDCGWIYNAETGRIKANSNNNNTDRDGYTESQY